MMEFIPRIENLAVYPDPYAERASADTTLMGLLHEQARQEYGAAVYQEQIDVGHRYKMPEEIASRVIEATAKSEEREGELYDIWQEVRGDGKAFDLLLTARDWQRIAEETDDPIDRADAIGQARDARWHYDQYRYGIDYEGGNHN